MVKRDAEAWKAPPSFRPPLDVTHVSLLSLFMLQLVLNLLFRRDPFSPFYFDSATAVALMTCTDQILQSEIQRLNLDVDLVPRK
jgi:hypothetical protein